MNRWERIVQWPGWRLLGAAAVAFVVGVVFYIGITVHQHNAQLDCIKRDFNQVLNEALRHGHIEPPPDC